MHPLQSAIEAAVACGMDFDLIVGGTPELRARMGLPPEVARLEALRLTFPAEYHRYSNPVAEAHGLSCVLSFDALYPCRIPWSAVHLFALYQRAEPEWPVEWGGEPLAESAPPPQSPATSDPGETPPSPGNVRQFRPRKRES